MKSIKQQFVEFRETTPKHVQWLLLLAAFVVVIILLTLVLSTQHNSTNSKKKAVIAKSVEIFLNPAQLDFTDVKVGERKQHYVKINVTDTVYINKTEIQTNNADWTITGDCKESVTDSCEISIEYAPSQPQPETETSLVVTYHLPDTNDLQTTDIPVKFSATEEEKPEPVIELEPEPELDVESVAEIESEPEPEPEPEPESEEIIEEEKIVAPEVTFAEPEPVVVSSSEKCSDFAIPGYNQAGIQIGWIKPEGGTNYFHPFSDKDCSKPTGKYDWNTGVITSLSDGSRIGTDSDHIGYKNIQNRGLTLPNLTAPNDSVSNAVNGKFENAVWEGGSMEVFSLRDNWKSKADTYLGSAKTTESVISSRPYDRTFILRQFKPIPATIVSEVRADPSVYGCSANGTNCDENKNHSIPVRATVDRNVFSDDGRTIIVPTGTLLMGYLDGRLPGPYQSFGRMNIKWYQFIRPDGVEFNFPSDAQDPYSGDAQGRLGVPGRGSTDYVEQMVMPILTAMVPAAVNLIAPIADTFVNQINLDTNTVVQSGTVRSSELAKQEIINQWNRITNKLVVDAISNTVPPFSIPAGTRINVYSPVDLIVTCGQDNDEDIHKKCAFAAYDDNNKRREWSEVKNKATMSPVDDSSWIGQVRSWDLQKYCEPDTSGQSKDTNKMKPTTDWAESGYDYRTVLMYCESLSYVAKNNVKNAIYSNQQTEQYQKQYGTPTYDNKTGTLDQSGQTAEQKKAYNEEILGLKYAEDGETILNPFKKQSSGTTTVTQDAITCDDGLPPDANGCCAGETYTDMGEQGFNCCPDSGGDCFPPITVE